MRTLTIQSLPALAVAVLVGLGSSHSLAGNMMDSGAMDMGYVKREALPAGDREGHVIMLAEAVGVHQNTARSAYLEGFDVSIRETAELWQGNGPHRGYVVFTKGADRCVVTFDGQVTTTLNEDGTPDTRFKGRWAAIHGAGQYAGIQGDGVYAGYFTAEDKFQVDWEGWHSLSELFTPAR
jgi:hypothetical protein